MASKGVFLGRAETMQICKLPVFACLSCYPKFYPKNFPLIYQDLLEEIFVNFHQTENMMKSDISSLTENL